MKQESTVISTRVLPAGELESLMNSIGSYLSSQGFAPHAHTPRLLTYQAHVSGKRGFYVGLFAPLHVVSPGVAVPVGGRKARVVTAHVGVTDLPVTFFLEEGRGTDVAVGYAFGVSAPAPVFPAVVGMITPYGTDLDTLRDNAGKSLEGRTINRRVPGAGCEHCGSVQEVTVPIEISRIDGKTGYGPGGSARVTCSNPGCGREFTVTWDRVVIEIDMK